MRDTVDFGLDLGTTNSAIAVCTSGAVEVIKNVNQNEITPSAVSMPRPNQTFVGFRAQQAVQDDPDNAAAEFKQEMGLADARRPFAVAGVSLTPQQLSAEVLKSLRADAAARFGSPPEAAVITVPAAFALNQNNATGQAATLAGFELPCPLLQEPTAAAFAYGFQDTDDRGYWMVFDFGGGTFDAAVVSKRDGELQVLNHAGDRNLGGKLIDWAIVERILAPRIARDFGLADFRRDNPAWRGAFALLKGTAEEAKILLSRQESVEVVPELKLGDAGQQWPEFTLHRGELDRIAEPFYARAIHCCRNALTEGSLSPDDIDRLLLVGGVTLAPGLRALLADPREGLGLELDFSQDPSTVVAKGAALFASTVPLDRPLAAPKAGEFSVELCYERSVSTTLASVGGRLHSATPVEWPSYSVSLHKTGGEPFHSGRITLGVEGGFATEVRIEERTTSRFTLELTDAAGRRQTLTPDTLAITHAAVEFGGAVLTQTLGIGTQDNAFVPLVAKGTPLPATGRGTFATTIALRRSDPDSVIRIPLAEGERDRTNRNHEVGVLEIRSTDLRIDLPVGSDVEVTIEIDKSRLISVVADVPLGQTQVEAELDLSNVLTPGADRLRELLDEAEQRLTRLRNEAQAISAQAGLSRLRLLDNSALAGVRDQVRVSTTDRGSAVSAEQGLRDLQAELDGVEDEVRLPGLLRELAEAVDECAELVGRYGQAEDRRELAALRGRADTAIADRDAVAARAQLERIKAFAVGLLMQSPDRDIILFTALREIRDQLVPVARAGELIREGEQVIAAGHQHALAGVNERLRRLIPPDVPDPIGWVKAQ